jgi:hypothetical protein
MKDNLEYISEVEYYYVMNLIITLYRRASKCNLTPFLGILLKINYLNNECNM